MRLILITISLILTACGGGDDGRDGRDGRDSLQCNYQADEKGVLFTCENGKEFRIDNGTIGPRGAKGPVGPRGPAGEPGAPGLKGDRGLDGSPGINGRNGNDGRPGLDGQDGVDGANFSDRLVCSGQWNASGNRRHTFGASYFRTGTGDQFLAVKVSFGVNGSQPIYSKSHGAFAPPGVDLVWSDGIFEAYLVNRQLVIMKIATREQNSYSCQEA